MRIRRRDCVVHARSLSPPQGRGAGVGGCRWRSRLRPVSVPLTHALSPSPLLSRCSCQRLPVPPSRGRSTAATAAWRRARPALPLRPCAVSDTWWRGAAASRSRRGCYWGWVFPLGDRLQLTGGLRGARVRGGARWLLLLWKSCLERAFRWRCLCVCPEPSQLRALHMQSYALDRHAPVVFKSE